jgi:hypothetical protein
LKGKLKVTDEFKFRRERGYMNRFKIKRKDVGLVITERMLTEQFLKLRKEKKKLMRC